MRLLDTYTVTLHKFSEAEVDHYLTYLTLSHRWGLNDSELTFQDLTDSTDGTYRDKQGYRKVIGACQVARDLGYQWLWIDTCCIDKRNSVELNEAINSMYRWYQKSAFCIAFLTDYTHGQTSLAHSEWFKRCWTLQELIAPPNVRFYDSQWNYFGSRRNEKLCAEISRITRISKHVLLGITDPKEYSIAQRLSWAADRKAERIEDETYSLLGILGISMSTNYGTGSTVFRSLQKKLLQDVQKQDLSLLDWARLPGEQIGGLSGLLAPSPAHFFSSHNVQLLESESSKVEFLRDCVKLEALSIPHAQGIYLCILPCTSTDDSYRRGIFLQRLEGGKRFARLMGEDANIDVHISWVKCQSRKVYCIRSFCIDHCPKDLACDWLPGIDIRRIHLPGYTASSTRTAYARSRCGGKFDLNGDSALLQLLPDQWGTTGVIYMPVGRPHAEDWKIRRIKVGFDANFRPTVWLGNYKSIQGCKWDNTWLDEHLSSSMGTPPNVPTSELEETHGKDQLKQFKEFKRLGFERHKALTDEGLDLDLKHLGIRLRLTLEELLEPPSEKGRKLIMMSSSRKVWTLKIDKICSSIPTHAIKKRVLNWGFVAASMVLLTLG